MHLDSTQPQNSTPETSCGTGIPVCRSNPAASTIEDLTSLPTEDLIALFRAKAEVSCVHDVNAARVAQEMHRRLMAGEMGDISWYSWAKKNLNISERKARYLLQIARAEDPEKEAGFIKLRHRAARKTQSINENKRDSHEPERKELAKFARKAPIELVRRLQEEARKLAQANLNLK